MPFIMASCLIIKNMTGLFKVKDPCTLGGGSDTIFGTTVDLGKSNSQFEVVVYFENL